MDGENMKLLHKLIFILALAAPALSAQAQSYPSKPIRLVCPFPPGGAVDIASRATAHTLSQILGQPVTVDNRPGAGGNIGAEITAKAAPDGYTLLMTTSGIMGINPALYSKIPFDSVKDFSPVSMLVSLNNVLVLHPSVPAKSVQEVIAMAKAQPGKLTYASSGNGTSIHLSGELFKSMAGVDMLHIPYKGSSPAVTDLLAGQVNMMFDNIPSSLPHIKSGKLRALAVTGSKRSPSLPDLPTIAEAGVPGYDSYVWFGVVAPAGTPPEIIAKLNAALVKTAATPEFRDRLTGQGYDVMSSTPEQMATSIRGEIAKWGKVVKASGAKVD
jgi:tripartite-type tricarboxylate transporter receptor subunit TctC